MVVRGVAYEGSKGPWRVASAKPTRLPRRLIIRAKSRSRRARSRSMRCTAAFRTWNHSCSCWRDAPSIQSKVLIPFGGPAMVFVV